MKALMKSMVMTCGLCRLGGVIGNVLAIGSEVRGLKPGQGDGFLKGNKNPWHTFVWIGNKAGGPLS
jgi:hypothetical protein